MASGVYHIVHLPTGREYVGSSGDVPRRFRVHRHLLRRGTHPARALQAAWDRDGEGALSFALLTPTTSTSARLALERAAIRERRPAFNGVTKRTQGGARMSTDRVALNARVDPSLRDAAHRAAKEQGISLNDFICLALQSAVEGNPPAPSQETTLLPLVELLTADMHLVREVLHAAYPEREAAARVATRSWLDKLGIGRRRGEQSC